jgi:hypothetical protein
MVKIIWTSSKRMNKVQQSYINIAFWACYCMQNNNAKKVKKVGGELLRDGDELDNFISKTKYNCLEDGRTKLG